MKSNSQNYSKLLTDFWKYDNANNFFLNNGLTETHFYNIKYVTWKQNFPIENNAIFLKTKYEITSAWLTKVAVECSQGKHPGRPVQLLYESLQVGQPLPVLPGHEAISAQDRVQLLLNLLLFSGLLAGPNQQWGESICCGPIQGHVHGEGD